VRRLALLPAALAALALPVPLQAQEPTFATAEESLKCAMWASYYVATYQGQDEEAVFVHALNYFVGRYEGLTGQGIDTATDEQLILGTANEIDALTPVCTEKMIAYGERMADWGAILAKIGDAQPEDASPAS
jgi:hypothetical protein